MTRRVRAPRPVVNTADADEDPTAPVDAPVTDERPDAPVLRAPADGVPDVVSDVAGLADAVARLGAGTGPVAVDTERAHGFRYYPRAYLLQFRRAGAGTFLIDPVSVAPEPGFAALAEALADAEWVIHAASQDLPCLVELGLVPRRIFDTELAARLLGYPRVALGTLVEELLGHRLLKEHSASDWSIRPLPADWLAYAALDVELLVELRDVVAAQLVEAGKDDWARQEFTHLVARSQVPPVERVDPWRRTAGTHLVRSPLGLALVRELWQTRDEIARRLDKAPGRILGDQGITELAAEVKSLPLAITRDTMRRIDRFNRREARRYESSWMSAVDRVSQMTRADLPPLRLSADGPPPPKSWGQKDPAAAARWEVVRPALESLAHELNLPLENLLSPDSLRRLLWQPTGLDAADLDTQLTALGARAWQRDAVVPAIVAALAPPAAD